MSRPAIAVTWAGLIESQAIKVPTDLYMLVLSLVSSAEYAVQDTGTQEVCADF